MALLRGLKGMAQRAAASNAAAPVRRVGLEGASNFRDLGGYRTADGRSVRWRTLFRSDRLSGLSRGDVRAVRALKIRRVVDFRGAAERESAPDPLTRATLYPVPIEPTVFARVQALLASGDDVTPQHMVKLMRDTYEAFVRNDGGQFARLFNLALESPQPLLFHCTAGKDRTGVAAALLLLALGVPRHQVVQDFLLTNRYYRAPSRLPQSQLSPEAMHVLWSVRPDFLEAAFATIDRDFGGVADYLQVQLGIGPAERRQLAAMYLE